MIGNRVRDEYFNWLVDIIADRNAPRGVSYEKLLSYLHIIPFRYSIPRDENRATDGLDLRYHFAKSIERDIYIEDTMGYLFGPCTVFEMMVALAMRCEETMNDGAIGDRTAQWFWGMVSNLGLGSMYDSRFDEEYIDEVIDIFLDREYSHDGKGGLFTVRNCDRDMRDLEIWSQLSRYQNTIT